MERIKAVFWHSLAIALLIFLIGLIGGLSYCSYSSLSVSEQLAFSGKVVDKRINRYESEYGGGIIRLLILEDEKGLRTTVRVSEAIYLKVEIGKWVVRDSNGTRWYEFPPHTRN